MGANICCSLILMQFFGAYGIPLAYSVSSLIGSGVLLWRLRKKIGSFATGLGTTLAKSILAALVMFFVVSALQHFTASLSASGVLMRILHLGLLCLSGVAVYFIMALLLRISQITDAVKDVLTKLRKRGA